MTGGLKIKGVVKTVRLDPNLKFEIAKLPGGENIKVCFQCQKCTASCPVRRIEDKYKPAQIIRAAILGLKEIVIKSDVIWLCAACQSCTERCPQGVRPSEVIRAIRNLAVKEGRIHPFYRLQGKAIVEYGRIFEDDSFINEIREDMGLPPLPPVDFDEVSKLLENTEVKRMLSSDKEGED